MKPCLSNTAGLKECSHFPFPSLPSIRSSIRDLCGRSSLWPSVFTIFFTFFWSLPYCWSGVAGGECNFWYTLEVAGEFGPAAPPLSSTLNWGFCSNSLSGCMVILNEWTCSEQEASASTYPNKKMVASFFFFFSSAETLIISKTANIGEVFIWIPCVYSSPRL